MATKNLTQTFVDRVALPESGRLKYWDSGGKSSEPGLGLILGKQKKTYVFATTTADRRSVQRTLGHHPQLSLAEARQAAREEREKIHSTGGRVPTLEKALAEYLEYMARKGRSSTWAAQMKREIEKHAGDWLSRRLDSLETRDALLRHERITDVSGPYVANRVMRALRAVINRALKRHSLVGKAANPILAVEWNAERAASLETEDAALPHYVDLLQKCPKDVRIYRLVVLLTGCRPAAAQKLRWENVWLDEAVFGFHDDKTGAYSVPVCQYLVEILRDYQEAEEGPLFPEIQSNPHRRYVKGLPPPKDWRKYFKTMAKRVGISDVDSNTLANHGLRTKTGLIGPDHYEFAGLDYYRPIVDRITASILETAGLSTRPSWPAH